MKAKKDREYNYKKKEKKTTKGQTSIYKALYRTITIEQHERNTVWYIWKRSVCTTLTIYSYVNQHLTVCCTSYICVDNVHYITD